MQGAPEHPAGPPRQSLEGAVIDGKIDHDHTVVRMGINYKF